MALNTCLYICPILTDVQLFFHWQTRQQVATKHARLLLLKPLKVVALGVQYIKTLQTW